MDLLDIFIIIFIFLGGLLGFKNGFTKSVVKFLGILAVLILSFILKNPHRTECILSRIKNIKLK